MTQIIQRSGNLLAHVKTTIQPMLTEGRASAAVVTERGIANPAHRPLELMLDIITPEAAAKFDRAKLLTGRQGSALDDAVRGALDVGAEHRIARIEIGDSPAKAPKVTLEGAQYALTKADAKERFGSEGLNQISRAAHYLADFA